MRGCLTTHLCLELLGGIVCLLALPQLVSPHSSQPHLCQPASQNNNFFYSLTIHMYYHMYKNRDLPKNLTASTKNFCWFLKFFLYFKTAYIQSNLVNMNSTGPSKKVYIKRNFTLTVARCMGVIIPGNFQSGSY